MLPRPCWRIWWRARAVNSADKSFAESKARSLDLTLEQDSTMETSPIQLHFTGCPNSCAQIQRCGAMQAAKHVADIGFMGTMARDENRKPVEGFDIYIGGCIDSDLHLGELVRRGMTGTLATQLLPVM